MLMMTSDVLGIDPGAEVLMPVEHEERPPGATPSVSVVISCHNGEPYLRRTIESVLAQDYPIHEIIAVDDASTDGTPDVLAGFADRVTVIRPPGGTNVGVAAARNLGIRHSNGEFLALLDQDDVWHPEKTRRQVEELLRRPEVGLVYSRCVAINTDDRVLYQFPCVEPPSGPDLAARVLMDCFIPSPSSVMFRRVLFDRVGGFDESLCFCDDHDFLIRLAEITNFALVDEVLIRYRRHNRQSSMESARTMWAGGFEVLAKACKRHPHYCHLKRRRLAVLHYRLGVCDWRDGNLVGAALRFLRAGLLDPIRGTAVVVAAVREHVHQSTPHESGRRTR
jgi:glycosyltransferase involved in cell wall biosynthesis